MLKILPSIGSGNILSPLPENRSTNPELQDIEDKIKFYGVKAPLFLKKADWALERGVTYLQKGKSSF